MNDKEQKAVAWIQGAQAQISATLNGICATYGLPKEANSEIYSAVRGMDHALCALGNAMEILKSSSGNADTHGVAKEANADGVQRRGTGNQGMDRVDAEQSQGAGGADGLAPGREDVGQGDGGEAPGKAGQ